MADTHAATAFARLDAVKDAISVKRVFGDAYEVDGVRIIPVAAVRGGGGGGGGEGTGPDAEGTGSGAGMGFGVHDRPVGVVVVKDGAATWLPTVDVTRIVIGGQIVALAAILVFGRVVRHRRHHRHHRHAG